MDRLSVLCFTGTYVLALVCDLARFVVRAPARWFATVGLLALGWVVHTAFLFNLARQHHQLRIATQYDFMLVLSWIFAAIALYLLLRMPRTVAIGVFVLPVVVVLSTLAGLERRQNWTNWGEWAPVWGAIHGWFLTIGAVFLCIAFVAGLTYLAQSRRLKRKRAGTGGVRLPSLEQSERLNRGAVTLAFPFLTFGLLIGVALNLGGNPATGGIVLRWRDPKVLSAGVTWLIFALLLHASFRPSMRGRRVMLLTVVAFALLMFTTVGVNLLLPTGHGGKGAPGGAGPRTPAPAPTPAAPAGGRP
jgi:ABC-type transport system involved in cytochrome c biogenesis permease subunit